MAIFRGAGGPGDATTDAANQASVASTKAAEAAASATAAASSATSAATEASNASTSASNSETSKIAAVAAQAAAELAETNAETAQAAAEAALDSFDDRYLGAKASDPTLDNDGNALITGALYFNTVTNVMFTYTGSIWQTITTGSGGLQAANNLSDVIDVSTSRTNLGVAIGTDVQAHSAVLDATTASYTTAEETKLAGIETAATADQTGAEIKAAYELEANAFTDAQFTKLAGIEASATADQTASEIKTAYESNADTNAFTDAEQTKLSNIDQGVATTDSPSFAGLTTTADINFGDNDRAIFGAGSDLQIYHNGSTSFIDDAGTGALAIRSNEIQLQKYTGETLASFLADSTVQLRYDNSVKLATTATGIDVTGTVVSDGLTVDTNTLYVDSTNNSVGIGTTSPNYKLDVHGANLGGTSGDTVDVLQLYSDVGNASYLNFQKVRTSTGSSWNSAGTRIQQVIDATKQGYIQFNGGNDHGVSFGTLNAERMRIDSTGNLLLGTTSSTTDLNYAPKIKLSGDGPGVYLEETDTSQSWSISALGSSFYIRDATTPLTRLVINSSGDVGIGLTNPQKLFHLYKTGGSTIRFHNPGVRVWDIGNNSTSFVFYDSTAAAERMRINSSGYVGIGTTGPTAPLNVSTTSGTIARFAATTNTAALEINSPVANYIALKAMVGDGLIFSTNNTEKMRIDTSGNVLVGTTTANGVGLTLGNQAANSGVPYIVFNKSLSGTVVVQYFYYNGVGVGSITTSNTATAYVTSSDYRLKEDWQPMSGSVDRVKALKPVNFAWKLDGSRVDGFLAHEAQAVVPEAVTGTHNEVDADGNPVMQGIDQSKLVPLLTAALQEAITKIEALEARVTALESN